MIPLTETQKRLSSVKEFTLKNLISVLRIHWYISDVILQYRNTAGLNIKNKRNKEDYKRLQVQLTYWTEIMFIPHIHRVSVSIIPFLLCFITPGEHMT